MQPVKMLSMVQLMNLLRIWGPMPNLFSLLRGKRCCCALFTTVLVCLDHDRSLVELEALDPLHYSHYNVVHNKLLCLTDIEGEVVVLAPHCQVSSSSVIRPTAVVSLANLMMVLESCAATQS
jgi:hypothetical protein